MGERIPSRLKAEPLVEAVWEVRFSGSQPWVSEVLPGILFEKFGAQYRSIVRLPAADIPGAVRRDDPYLRYVPKVRLEDDRQAIQVGERVVSLSRRRPYPGWERFASEIREVADAVRATELVERLERFSLRYISIVEDPAGLSSLDLESRLGSRDLRGGPLHLRAELAGQGGTQIVQILFPAEMASPDRDASIRGVLVDIDGVREVGERGSWDEVDRGLDALHSELKGTFFDILKPETLARLGPEYEDGGR